MNRRTNELDDRIGSMQREPSASTLDPLPQSQLLVRTGHHIARVGDQHVRTFDPLKVTVVTANPHVCIVMYGKHLQQLEASEVRIVVVRVANQVRLQELAHGVVSLLLSSASFKSYRFEVCGLIGYRTDVDHASLNPGCEGP